MPAKTYGALNPEQLAKLFEMRADIAEQRAETEDTNFKSRLRIREQSVWLEAAYIVRNTEFVGWTPNSRIVEEILPIPGTRT